MMCFGVKSHRKPVRTNHCVIVLLDDTQLVHELHSSSTGQDLLDVVIKHLNLLETSYFGLKYLESSGESQGASYARRANSSRQHVCWLDVNKSAIKQLRNVQPMTVYFGVKYYAADPCKLAEEITRYQFFLQCKQDILHGRLQVNFELAVELFALAVQSELGDFDPQRHLEGYVGEFQFLQNQTQELEARAAIYHRSLCGQVPATAELNFLERVKWLELYGAQLFPIQYDDEQNSYDEYSLALNPSGVLVLRNKSRVVHYLWPRIVKSKCQGRCFLMDVIQAAQPGGNGKQERHRFGFRLADKESSRRLAWSIEEHRGFYHLLYSSAPLNQHLGGLNQGGNQLKLSQRFRNSIRSAINGGALPFAGGQLQPTGQQHNQKLRSSLKSLQQVAPDRQQPTVVRMPSRRYGNRASLAQNGGRPGMAHTMVESQRQQALLMINQLNQMSSMAGKSQTLRPSSKLSYQQAQNELKRNPYYQQLMSMLAQQQQPDIAILPPGRHVVQPAIYKATSIMNGINQMAPSARPAQIAGPAMVQFFSTPQSQLNGYREQGHESPRSTKSAIAPSSALKMASKKLLKQQQLALYNNRNNTTDVQPLLAFEHGQYPATPADQYANYQQQGFGSACQSPRSVRSARIRHRSKSTGENLNLMHQQQQMAAAAAALLASQEPVTGKSKMLLATTKQLLAQQAGPPPPAYNASARHHSANKRRANLPLTDSGHTSLLLNTSGLAAQSGNRKYCLKARGHSDDDDDDYCCSRSDCSSVERDHQQGRRLPQLNQPEGTSNRPQEEWNAIRKRHSEFSSGKGNFSNLSNFVSAHQSQTKRRNADQSPGQDARRQPIMSNEQLEDQLVDTNNNPPSGQQLLKNIPNKQATPILLSMNQFCDGTAGNSNTKAVQLLNMQRQHLNCQSGQSPEEVGSGPGSNKSSSALDSAASSMASSPQAANVKPGSHQQSASIGSSSGSSTASQCGNKTSDSANSNTSGYYAPSNNSTGSASLDSDSQADQMNPKGAQRRLRRFDEWPEEGTRAKIALGSYAGRLAGNRFLMGAKGSLGGQQPGDVESQSDQQKQFYLDDLGPAAKNPEQGSQWTQANQSPLKYVSFDV